MKRRQEVIPAERRIKVTIAATQSLGQLPRAPHDLGEISIETVGLADLL